MKAPTSSGFLALTPVAGKWKVVDFPLFQHYSPYTYILFFSLSFSISPQPPPPPPSLSFSMDTNQWPQGIGLVQTIESPKPARVERKARPQKEQALNCPRCNSTNTKFCYYNNYSLSQPRYFCKTCRRYWTEGGTLRNVPVGGGSRKNKRSISISTSSQASAKKLPDLSHLTSTAPGFCQPSSQNPKIHEGHDLNLAYPPTGSYGTSTNLSGLIGLPYTNNNEHKSLDDDPNSSNMNSSSISHTMPALELLKSTGISPKGLSSLMSMPLSVSNTIYSSVIPMQDFKPNLNFSLDGFDNGYGSSLHGVSNSARLFVPYEDLKPHSMSSTDQYDRQQNRGQAGEPSGYWNGMLGGGGSW